MVIDEAAILIRPVVKLPHGGQTQMRETVTQFREVFLAQHLSFPFVRASGHVPGMVSCSYFVRLDKRGMLRLCSNGGREVWAVKEIFIAWFGGIVLLFIALRAAIDLAASIDYAQETVPWFKKFAETQKWHRILLTATCLFYGGTLYELLQETPLVPLRFTDPGTPVIAPIVQENRELTARLASQNRKESRNSLRRQVWRLADQIDQFWVAKRKEAPSPGEDQQQRKMQKWIEVSDRECNGKFKDKILGLVQEVEAKGVNAKVHGWLDWSAILVQNQRCPQGDELESFRELGFHLDANDNEIEIKF
jgi:hypothetical protein